MRADVQRVLIPEAAIRARVAELAQSIDTDYAGRDLVLVGILKGAALFCSELFRQITIPARLDFMRISSYGASTKSTGVHRVLLDLDYELDDAHVLLVEDIVDTGLTVRFLLDYLARRHPGSLKVASLLDKPSRRKVPVPIDYCGFAIPDEFVVGWGLDFAERYRNLPDICVLQPAVYGKPAGAAGDGQGR